MCRILTLVAPILAHTAFDWILMVSDAVEYQITSAILTVLFLMLFIRLQRIGREKITTQLNTDREI